MSTVTEQASSRFGVAWSRDGSSMVKLPDSSVVANAELAAIVLVFGPSLLQVTATLLPGSWKVRRSEPGRRQSTQRICPETSTVDTGSSPYPAMRTSSSAEK